jgi:hypothetical protein
LWRGLARTVETSDGLRRTIRTDVFALEVRISGKWDSNQAKFLPR